MTDSVLTADWLVPAVTSPIRDAAVVVSEGKVAWLGRAKDLESGHSALPAEHVDGVVIPGLVNAHTHLQYTGFDAVGRGSYRSFEQWSEAFEVAYSAVDDPSHWHAMSRSGADLALRSGTTHVADIVTDDSARGAIAEAGLGGIEYLEAIALTEARWHSGADAEFAARLDAPSRGAVGVSPHAPYSLDAEVIRALVAMARRHGIRIHSHVAESSVEAALYATGDTAVLSIYGGIRTEFDLSKRGGSGRSTGAYAEYVDLLGSDAHIAHGIYLDRADRDRLLATQTAVALCPRSNAVIGLDAAPVADYLREGHPIAVGTDSLASSPSLDLLEDVRALRSIARSQGYLDRDLDVRLLEAATVGGAAAMGLEGAGRIVEGGQATLVGLAIEADSDVERTIVTAGGGSCSLVMIDGEVVHRA